jgi:cytochrome c oxidase assembly factor CtaG
MMGNVALEAPAGSWGLTVRIWLARLRPRIAVVAVVLILGTLLPAESYARRYAFVETLQFVIFAVAAPALLVLGGPWRFTGLTRDQDSSPGSARRFTPSRWPGVSRPAAVLLVFIAVVIAWRLPVTVNALPRDPALIVAEAVTLLASGSGVWLELAKPPLLVSGLSRPQRAAMAAGAMWTIWVLAYIIGMSHGTWFAAYRHAGHGLSTSADQQLAVGIMWAIPALCFAPFIYGTLIAWLGDSEDPDHDLREAVHHRPTRPSLDGRLRPPRGWRGP